MAGIIRICLILFCSFTVLVGLTGHSSVAFAARALNDAQLKYVFSDAEFTASGGACAGRNTGSHFSNSVDIEFKFRRDGDVSMAIHCLADGAFSWSETEKARWSVEDGSVCIVSDGDFFSQTHNSEDECWSVKEGRFGLVFQNSTGDVLWRLKITKHPKHSTKEDLLSALKAVKNKNVSAGKPASVSIAAADSAAWEAVKYSNRISDFQRYLETYPNGLFISLAENQIRDLIKRQNNPDAALTEFADVEFGNYHALVIGIDDYKYISKLGTAVRDAKAIAKLLAEHYGFNVQTLIDPDRADIVDAFDEYRESLTENDNLLIYYAGHGWLDEEAEEGYWLTAKAKSNRRSQWVSNATITKTLKTLPAKHVMVVADSCYSGTLTRAAAVGFRDSDYLKRMAGKRARVAMVSGGLEPVADDSGTGNSPFAKAFIDALNNNTSVIDGTRLFSQIRRPVILNAQQTPEYSDVRNADHDGGDFLFVRRN